VLEFNGCLGEGGSRCGSDSAFVIENVGPGVCSRCAVVLPYGGEIESKFVAWNVQPNSRETFAEAIYFATRGFKKGVYGCNYRR
jgi:hypothetical protein